MGRLRQDEQEVLELQRIVRLTSSQLRQAGQDALELEARAYQRSPDVYAHTEPAQRAGTELRRVRSTDAPKTDSLPLTTNPRRVKLS